MHDRKLTACVDAGAETQGTSLEETAPVEQPSSRPETKDLAVLPDQPAVPHPASAQHAPETRLADLSLTWPNPDVVPPIEAKREEVGAEVSLVAEPEAVAPVPALGSPTVPEREAQPAAPPSAVAVPRLEAASPVSGEAPAHPPVKQAAPTPTVSPKTPPGGLSKFASNAGRLAATAGRYLLIALAAWFGAMVLLIALFRVVDPPTSALMLIRAAQGVDVDQRWVPLEEISPSLVRAVIVSEDGRFCRHWGIDPLEIRNAIRRSNGGTPRGASTITMQLAKNLFLWPQQSYLRKILEVPLTLTIDALWPKRRIAEVYLNIVEWGPGIFGADVAARRHFDTSPAKLSARQSALLAVTLPNPLARQPAKPTRLLNRMASTIMARMRSTPGAADCVLKGN